MNTHVSEHWKFSELFSMNSLSLKTPRICQEHNSNL